MLNSYIELILSLVVIFALLSVLVSLLNELYRNIIRDRGKMLYNYVQKMFKDEKNVDLAYLTFRHPLINNARHDDSSRPSYIEPKLFAAAFVQTVGDLSSDLHFKRTADSVELVEQPHDPDPLKRFIEGVNTMHHTPLKKTLLSMAERAQMDEHPHLHLENQIIEWFNNQMRILSMNYKGKQRKSLLFFGIVVTLFLNIDSLYLVHELRNDDQLRLRLTSQASEIEAKYTDLVKSFEKNLEFKTASDSTVTMNEIKSTLTQLKKVKGEVNALELPIGYSKKAVPLVWFYAKELPAAATYADVRNYPGFLSIVFYLLGLAISAFSLSMGAPFWFDLLNKLIRFRGGK